MMQNFPCSENIEIDRMNISVKKELEGSDDEDDLNGKKGKVSNFDSDFDDRNNNCQWLKIVP